MFLTTLKRVFRWKENHTVLSKFENYCFILRILITAILRFPANTYYNWNFKTSIYNIDVLLFKIIIIVYFFRKYNGPHWNGSYGGQCREVFDIFENISEQ